MWSIVVGALAPGVNLPTFLALNVVLALAVLSLLGLLVHSVLLNPVLTPHVVVLLVLAAGLWGSVVFVCTNLGFADPAEQEKHLFGKSGEAEDQQGEDQQRAEAGDLAADATPEDAKKQQ